MRLRKKWSLSLIGIAAASWLTLVANDAQAQEKAGPWMLNLKLGPAIGVSNADTEFALVLDANYGIAFNRNLYIGLPINLQFSGSVFTGGLFPIQVQYDFAIPQVRGLYVYPRFVVGYGLIHVSGGGGGTSSAAFIEPAAGVKYILNGRWNFGFEPFSMPIFARSGAAVFYRLLFYAGINL